MNILHLDSSVLGLQSSSRQLSAAIVQQLNAEGDHQVIYRDLDAAPIPHLSSASLAAADPAEQSLARQLLDELLAADVLVIGAPMYNFSIASTLKAWIDRIAVAGTTFRYTAQGAQGLLTNKHAIIVSTRGGVHGNGPSDHQESYLRTVLGFVGIQDIEVVRAEGLNMSGTARELRLQAALHGPRLRAA